MMVCEECGFENDDGDQFCGSCQKFLGFWGAKVETESVVAEDLEPDEKSERFKTVKQVLSVDDATVADFDAQTKQVEADDANMAAAVLAKKAADDAAVAERQSEQAAATRLAQVEQQRAEAKRLAEEAERELVRAQEAKAAEAEQRRRTAAAADFEAKRHLEEQLKSAEDKAKSDAAAAALAAEAEFAEKQRAAEAVRVAANAAAETAREAEEDAARASEESQRKLEEAAAAASAAALRAAQEHDAMGAANAAREAGEAESARARAEIAAAAAKAAEEVARAKAEMESARAEAADLRARADADAARSELDRQRTNAEKVASEETARARRRAEDDAAAKRERDLVLADAAALRQAAEADAAERKAQSELLTRQAEAKTAIAREEEARVRAATEAEAAKRKKEAALMEAERLLAPAPKRATEAPVKPSTGAQSKAKGKAGGASESTAVSPSSVSSGAGSSGGIGPQKPGEGVRVVPPRPKGTPKEPLNPGDLICPKCGRGNVPTRKFCRSCAGPLNEAQVAKLGFFARFRAKRRLKRELRAGARPGQTGSNGSSSFREKGRDGWWRLNALLMRAGAMLGVVALLGFGVEPIRAKLQLPNVRQKVFDSFKKLKPVYDPVRAVGPAASSSVEGTSPGNLIDLKVDRPWMGTGGAGEWVSVSFEKPVDLGRLLLTSGLNGTDSDNGFVSQPRPSELRVTFNDDEANPKTVRVQDIGTPQTLKVEHKDVVKVRFQITDVYPSFDGKGTHVTISEMEFFQRRKLGDDFETIAPPTITPSSPAAAVGVGALTDDDLSTAWFSAPDGDGVGQGFSVSFATPADIDRIRIAPGQAEATFQSSPRPRDVQLAFECQGRCDATKQLTLPDKPGFHNVRVKATGVTKITVLVRSVYGTGGGAAFAELQFQRMRPKVN